jgi:hypothetical protein
MRLCSAEHEPLRDVLTSGGEDCGHALQVRTARMCQAHDPRMSDNRAPAFRCAHIADVHRQAEDTGVRCQGRGQCHLEP